MEKQPESNFVCIGKYFVTLFLTIVLVKNYVLFKLCNGYISRLFES